MKKFAFSVFLVLLAFSLFAQTAGDYDRILRGDFSAFAGYYVTEEGGRIFLRPDGKTAMGNTRVGQFKKTEGIYSWFESGAQDGWSIILVPIGVEIKGKETDTTKVRIWPAYGSIYYRESEFPATHVTTENLRIREDQNLSSETIKIIEKGTKVLVQEWGNYLTIEGNSARWAYVYSNNGFWGWCYSGYLEEIKE
jgi:hypothetical protein